MEVNGNKVIKGFFWRLLERIGAQSVSFLVSLILARILDPKVYGTVALITVITSILQAIVEGGFCSALVQKKDADEKDFSTVFYFNFLSSIFLYFILFILAPVISDFYNLGDLTPVIRVSGLSLIIYGVKGIQQAYVSRRLEFKKFFFSTIVGTIAASVVGVFMALKGFGVWALVIQGLLNSFIDTIILWFTVKWRPKLIFSITRFKKLFSYGWKLLLSSMFDRLYNETRSLIIGKRYNADDLAYYNKGDQFPEIIVTNVNYSISSVLLPTMSIYQDDAKKVKEMTRQAIKLGSFITMPCMMGLAACSIPIISLLLTDKWLPAVPFMVLFCLTYAFFPIHTANLNAIKAMGRSDLFLLLEIIKKTLGISIILCTMWFGVYWIAFGGFISSILGQIINSWPNKKLLNYSYLEQIKDLLPSLIISLIMCVIVFGITYLGLSNWLTLVIQIPLGIIIYLGISSLVKNDSFLYCKNVVKRLLKRS